MNRTIVGMMIALTLSCPLVTLSMYEDEITESMPLLNKNSYPVTRKYATAFGFSNAQTNAMHFFHAVEDNKNINSYLKNKNITGNYLILTVGYAIAQQMGNNKLQQQIQAKIQEKYPSMLQTK